MNTRSRYKTPPRQHLVTGAATWEKWYSFNVRAVTKLWEPIPGFEKRKYVE